MTQATSVTRQTVLSAVAATLLLLATACDKPPGPTPVPQSAAPTTVRVSGIVVDDSLAEVAVPNATVIPRFVASDALGFRDVFSVSTVSDAAGGFSLDVTIPADWNRLGLEVRRTGFETDSDFITRDAVSAARVHAYRTLTLRAGESITTRLFTNSVACGSESHRCRRIDLDLAPGESLDLELKAVDGGQEIGLAPFGEPGVPFKGYVTKLTTSERQAWIIGRTTAVTLTARKPSGQ